MPFPRPLTFTAGSPAPANDGGCRTRGEPRDALTRIPAATGSDLVLSNIHRAVAPVHGHGCNNNADRAIRQLLCCQDMGPNTWLPPLPPGLLRVHPRGAALHGAPGARDKRAAAAARGHCGGHRDRHHGPGRQADPAVVPPARFRCTSPNLCPSPDHSPPRMQWQGRAGRVM